MIMTKMDLVNAEKIEGILREIVTTVYNQIKNMEMLLYINGRNFDLLVATEGDDLLDDAIKENFQLDEFDDIIDESGYYELLRDLQEAFIDIHKTCGLFDFFPAGEYEIDGERCLQKYDCIAPIGKYYAPFEDALIIVH